MAPGVIFYIVIFGALFLFIKYSQWWENIKKENKEEETKENLKIGGTVILIIIAILIFFTITNP